MKSLPLFPLPIVLLPEAHLPLHIFEPRYRRMVARCLEYDRRFGLVFHDPDVQGPFLIEPGRVGCIAEIETFELLEDGRSLILTRGRERFAITEEVDGAAPYYEARVETYEDETDPLSIGLPAQRRSTIDLFEAVLANRARDTDAPQGLDPAKEVSFILAATIRTDPAWMQRLLEMRDESERLRLLDQIFLSALGTGSSPEA